MHVGKEGQESPFNSLITICEWVRHFAAESAGAIVLYLVIPTLGLAAILLFGCIAKDLPAAIPICIVCAVLSVLILLIIVRFYRSWRRMIQADRASNSISKASRSLILELSGSYTPYIIESAEKLGVCNEPSVTPALLLVLERAVAEQRSSWQDIVEAIIEALGNLGDPRALPVLESLRNVKEIRNLSALRIAIERLGVSASHAQLLRPVAYDPTVKSMLLRSAADRRSESRDSLLRAAERLIP
jgi:hypothetical protein